MQLGLLKRGKQLDADLIRVIGRLALVSVSDKPIKLRIGIDILLLGIRKRGGSRRRRTGAGNIDFTQQALGALRVFAGLLQIGFGFCDIIQDVFVFSVLLTRELSISKSVVGFLKADWSIDVELIYSRLAHLQLQRVDLLGWIRVRGQLSVFDVACATRGYRRQRHPDKYAPNLAIPFARRILFRVIFHVLRKEQYSSHLARFSDLLLWSLTNLAQSPTTDLATQFMTQAYHFDPIGIFHTCFKEKFGIPRQPGLVTGAEGVIKLGADPLMRTALRELESFSHLWVIFVFHDQGLGSERTWKPSIRPPRLGGARKVGVLASRSPHRPNPIGLSAVKLERIDFEALGGIEIHVTGVDVLDGTPVLDIKPYLPYADAIADANAGWATEPIARTEVEFTSQAHAAIAGREERYPRLKPMIVEMLSLDPRPAFQKRRMPPQSVEAQGARFGFRLFEYDVKWEIRGGRFVVLDVVDFGDVASK